MKLRPNRIKHKLAEGDVAYVVSGITHPDDIDAFGPVGFDGIWLEGEHGAVDAAELGNLTRACDIWGMTSIVRVNRNEQSLIYRTLDRGAQGIIVPHVNTREEAQNVVIGGKFAPIGHRGMYTSRQGYGVEDYYIMANNVTLLIVLIEDIAAVRNLNEILTVDHIDVFFVAPVDLAASMGYIGDIQNPEVQNTVDNALASISAAGRTAGTIVSNDTVAKYAAAGVRFFLTAIGGWLATAAAEFIKRLESSKSGDRKSSRSSY
jgi:2-keto-3-deoxy-L-rhamnonate aldolase RhmA